MTEGTIVKWCKKEGEAIAAGDVLCEIQTDKAVVSMEWDDDAVLAKILVPEGSAGINVNSLIALMVNEGEDWKDVQVPGAPGKPVKAGKKSKSGPNWRLHTWNRGQDAFPVTHHD
jgi:pyruvate/2-oxoglutarate dehydrogenase complex dihydrolipoamide acyltransferase (E2) component